jgi:hypothetical protein
VHLRQSGFTVKTVDLVDLGALREKYGLPRALTSCHTALVGGYVVEGHVPAGDVRRLLAERPKVTGIAVPGMPAGSPGMEGPVSEPYDTIAFGGGRTWVFARHRPVVRGRG